MNDANNIWDQWRENDKKAAERTRVEQQARDQQFHNTYVWKEYKSPNPISDFFCGDNHTTLPPSGMWVFR